MRDMFDRASAGVREDETVALKLLLINYRGDFLAVKQKHVIDTKDARPVKQKLCRTPLALEGEEKNTFKNFWMWVLYPGVFQNGRPLQCWLGRGMALSDIVLI